MSARPLAFVVTLALAGCGYARPGPNVELTRLDAEIGELRADAQVVAHSGPMLARAEAELDRLAAQQRRLTREAFHHGVYIVDRLVRIAKAQAQERAAAQRRAELEAERAALAEQLRQREERRANAPAVAKFTLPSWTGSGAEYTAPSASAPLADSDD